MMSKVNFPLTSPAFKTDGDIPVKYSCEGENVNPPLMIGEVPRRTKSLAIVVDDPDADKKIVTHWIAWNIPAQTRMIREGERPGVTGKNEKGENKYMGPCPPSGKHHYYFKVYALDRMLDLKESTTKGELEKAMTGHILAEGQLVGLYEKQPTAK
ncbi:MAG: YbhB/YbcL family Raf kinase inhibitor-like protein [Bacteroidetes bacterium]|nr:YbhB/YbcL family Raf kinase inhibitor-like protein [Bacteroidota bacterium]